VTALLRLSCLTSSIFDLQVSAEALLRVEGHSLVKLSTCGPLKLFLVEETLRTNECFPMIQTVLRTPRSVLHPRTTNNNQASDPMCPNYNSLIRFLHPFEPELCIVNFPEPRFVSHPHHSNSTSTHSTFARPERTLQVEQPSVHRTEQLGKCLCLRIAS
jgi:hypothetical protein